MQFNRGRPRFRLTGTTVVVSQVIAWSDTSVSDVELWLRHFLQKNITEMPTPLSMWAAIVLSHTDTSTVTRGVNVLRLFDLTVLVEGRLDSSFLVTMQWLGDVGTSLTQHELVSVFGQSSLHGSWLVTCHVNDVVVAGVSPFASVLNRRSLCTSETVDSSLTTLPHCGC